MNYTRLEHSLIDLIKEEQAKLGFHRESVRLYYPLSTLNHLLEAQDTVEGMINRLEYFPEAVSETLGTVTVTRNGDRFCFHIPEEGSVYVHDHMESNEFIAQLVSLVQNHGCSIEEIRRLFLCFSPSVSFERVDNGEFDYRIQFLDRPEDPYIYCFKDEGCHMIYHRFLPEDYEDFGF